MITEKDIELIDHYLANKLSEVDKASFEKRLQNDAELSREFRLQKDIVNAIQKVRIAELKSVLNKVPITPAHSSQSTTIIKVSIGITTAIILTSLTYFLVFNPKSVTQPQAQKPSEKNSLEVDSTQTSVFEEEQPETNLAVQNKEVKTQKSDLATNNTLQQKSNKEPKLATEIKEGKAVDPKIEVFDPNSDEIQEEEKPIINDKPEEDVFTKSNTLRTEVIYKERKHNFHYQLIGDKLTLIGPFRKELYEVLEFFANDKRTAFLYFNKSYYSLTATESEKELKPVMDSKLIERLEQYRKQN
ncbi:MAG: hypothetical protein ACK5WV_06785 [Chryseotalea sp.]